MKLYGAIDLHSNNSVVAVLDEQDRVVYQSRLANDLGTIIQALFPYKGRLQGLVVESTYNWYWLVDGLMESGHTVHLANTAAIRQYEGLKYSDDNHDARWLAHMLRLGVLKEGHIYPKEDRPLRDLLRKRAQLVGQRTAQMLSIQNLYARNSAKRITANQIRKMTEADVDLEVADFHLGMAIKSNLAVFKCTEVSPIHVALDHAAKPNNTDTKGFREGLCGAGKTREKSSDKATFAIVHRRSEKAKLALPLTLCWRWGEAASLEA
ncbi:MAG: transposase [Magnetococcales bacterium]|nr:transposase [Magnetococcales bacterium]